MGDQILTFTPTYDGATRQATLTGDAGQGRFTVAESGAGLLMQGTLGSARLDLRLSRIDVSRMTLVGRGFHWISNETYEP